LGASVDRTGVELIALLLALVSFGRIITDEGTAGIDGGRGTDRERGARSVGCWMPVAARFVIGVMSLVWMAVVAALIAAEKLLPRRRAAVATVTGRNAAPSTSQFSWAA